MATTSGDFLRNYFKSTENTNDIQHILDPNSFCLDGMKQKLMKMYSSVTDQIINEEEEKLNSLRKLLTTKISKVGSEK